MAKQAKFSRFRLVLAWIWRSKPSKVGGFKFWNRLKQALLEILEERQDLAEALFLEALEDWGLIQAIREGKETDNVTREAVFETLESIQWR